METIPKAGTILEFGECRPGGSRPGGEMSTSLGEPLWSGKRDRKRAGDGAGRGWADILQSSPRELHNRPDIPSPRKELRTKPLDHLGSPFQAMAWIISEPSSVRSSGTVTVSPNIPGHTSPHTPTSFCTQQSQRGAWGPGQVMKLGNYLCCLREKHREKLGVNRERFCGDFPQNELSK